MSNASPTMTSASGILAELRIEAPENCPISEASERADGVAESVSRSVPNEANAVVEDFTIDSTAEIDHPELTEVYSADGETTYRFTRERDGACVCEAVESFGLPVSDVRARRGELILSIYVTDVETVKAIIAGLRETFDGVYLHRLARTGDRSSRDAIEVDRGALTDRQREVLETAFEMGHFSYPMEANANEVADELGICPSTFAEHLSTALSKLLASILSE